MNLQDIKITFEDWRYTAIYKDELWTIITDWKTIDKLMIKIKEAFQLHYWITWNDNKY